MNVTDKQRQGCNHHERRNTLHEHTMSSLTMLLIYYNSESKKVHKILAQLSVYLNSGANAADLPEKKLDILFPN